MVSRLTELYIGSVSDKSIFDENIDSHLVNLAKRTGEMTLEDSEPGMEQKAVLADKGYQSTNPSQITDTFDVCHIVVL
ncbi:hypothetical protein DYB34_011436 [Aphanomyces astaci]|uniref:DDE Tnp4 domain-containing protein n=1 Tax=Aphanomyces astaci TaxID=112090 RepID=A0A3R7A7C2_APHAT|nr:hypothetical protein DYB34_011436 [Aphanomyces astaci]